MFSALLASNFVGTDMQLFPASKEKTLLFPFSHLLLSLGDAPGCRSWLRAHTRRRRRKNSRLFALSSVRKQFRLSSSSSVFPVKKFFFSHFPLLFSSLSLEVLNGWHEILLLLLSSHPEKMLPSFFDTLFRQKIAFLCIKKLFSS